MASVGQNKVLHLKASLSPSWWPRCLHKENNQPTVMCHSHPRGPLSLRHHSAMGAVPLGFSKETLPGSQAFRDAFREAEREREREQPAPLLSLPSLLAWSSSHWPLHLPLSPFHAFAWGSTEPSLPHDTPMVSPLRPCFQTRVSLPPTPATSPESHGETWNLPGTH